MRVIKARNVQQALPEALHLLQLDGVHRDSRNGPVIMFPEPVTTVYERPDERVVFWPERDANPFFHLAESLWMLAGRNDVEYVAGYVQRMREFSDDGRVFHGAYGFRWREHFGFDQLQSIIKALIANPDDRRQVLSMWDAHVDLGRQGKDFPCNLQASFQVAPDGRLDMMVTNRSNDMVWGAYGANAVHFSVLHEYMARSIGRPLGRYRQVSANFHTYLSVLDQVRPLISEANPGMSSVFVPNDPYENNEVSAFPLMSVGREGWDHELMQFFTNPLGYSFVDPFFRDVAVPMHHVHLTYKSKSATRFRAAYALLKDVKATDWQRAAYEWLQRREQKAQARRERANDDGVTY